MSTIVYRHHTRLRFLLLSFVLMSIAMAMFGSNATIIYDQATGKLDKFSVYA